jgi:outer membrane protein assembly factor BamB
MKYAIILGTCLLFLAQSARPDDWPQWRGPERNGTSKETGLLQEWPKEGPNLAWKNENVGSGYAAPSVVGNRVYLLGNQGLENEFVEALDSRTGQRLWQTRLGNVGNPKQNPNFPAARSTPTVDREVLYALGSDGDLACVELSAGKIRWAKNLRAEFGGKPGQWAYAESPLLDGETVICTPGGKEATIVGLNARTGETKWRCALPEGDEAAYASAVIVETGGAREYAQLLQKGLVGIDANTGKFLWRYSKPISPYGANIPTPLPDRNLIYVSSAGAGGGAVRLKPKPGGMEAEQLYFEAKLPTAIGGAVKIGPNLYGTTSQALLCTDFATGKVIWQERALGAASLCYADKRLYLHGENGEAALVEPSASGYVEKGRFSPPDQPKHANQMEKSWAYPVVANGRFYLRDHQVLWCYDVSARK